MKWQFINRNEAYHDMRVFRYFFLGLVLISLQNCVNDDQIPEDPTIVDFKIYQDSLQIDLTSPMGTVVNGPGGVAAMNQFEYTNDSAYRIINTGTIEFEYFILNEDPLFTVLESSVVLPKDTVEIHLPLSTGMGFVRCFLKVDASGYPNKSDQKVNIGADGFWYVSLINL